MTIKKKKKFLPRIEENLKQVCIYILYVYWRLGINMTHIFCFLRKIVARWLFNDLLYKHRYITFPRFYFHRFYIRETITQRELFFARQLTVRGSASSPNRRVTKGARKRGRGEKKMK